MKVTEQEFIDLGLPGAGVDLVEAIKEYHNGHFTDADILKACGAFDYYYENYRKRQFRCVLCQEYFTDDTDLNEDELCEDCRKPSREYEIDAQIHGDDH